MELVGKRHPPRDLQHIIKLRVSPMSLWMIINNLPSFKNYTSSVLCESNENGYLAGVIYTYNALNK